MWEYASRLVLSGLILFSSCPLSLLLSFSQTSWWEECCLKYKLPVSERCESYGRIFYLALILFCFHPLHQNNNRQTGDAHNGGIRWNWKATSVLAQKPVSISTPTFSSPSLQGCLVTLCITAALPRPLIIADVNIIARVTPLTPNKADTVDIMCVQFHIWCMRAVAINVYSRIVGPRWVIFDNDIFWPQSDRKVVIMGTAANTVWGHG